MKLIYVYVEHHNVLKDISVIFSSSHRVTFERKKQLCLKTVVGNLDYYGGIQSTAIVGKNGTGKSTLLDFIESSYEATDSSGLIVWFDERENVYHICPINFEMDLIEVKSIHTVKINKNYRNFLNNHKVRLIKANSLSGSESSAISARSRKNIFSHDLSLSRYKVGSPTKLAQRISRLMSFFVSSSWMVNEQNMKVEFEFLFKPSSTTYLKNILNREADIRGFKIPPEDLVILNNMTEGKSVFISDAIDDLHVSLFSELMRINILSIFRYATKHSGFRPKLQDYIFVKLLSGFFSKGPDFFKLDTVGNIIRDSKMYDFYSISSLLETDAIIVFKRFYDVVEVIKKISEVIIAHRMDIEIKGNDRFTSSQATLVVNLMMLISKLPNNIVSNFHYGWKGFSTGEFAKLNLFAELFYYINNKKRSRLESHLIVMDEADLYLHPDWQREFLADTLSFLGAEYPRDSVQLVLTSHSPIIIGDFLPEDIISMHRNANDSPQIGESFGFGTQILQLYMDGMHLSSTFGSHSKYHLDRIMNNKVNNCQSPFDRELISKIKNPNIRRMLGSTE